MEVEKEEKEGSLRDDILAAMSELEKEPTESKTEEVKEEVVSEPVATETKEAKAKTDIPAQEVGKAQKGKAEPSTEAAPVAPNQVNSEIPAPISWKAEKREAFASLPRDVKQYIVDRERESQSLLTQKSQEFAQAIRGHEELLQVIEPEMQKFARARVSPAQAVHYLLKGQEFLETNPQEAIKRLADMHGVDLQSLALNGSTEANPEIQTLRRELDELRGYYSTQQEQAQQQYISSLNNHVEAFRQAKDAEGNQLYPYASDPQFEDAMSYEVRKLRAVNPQMNASELLTKAYENTLWTMPELREAELKKRAGINDARRISDEKAKAAKARNLAVTVNGAPRGTSKLNSSGSLRGDISAAMEALGF